MVLSKHFAVIHSWYLRRHCIHDNCISFVVTILFLLFPYETGIPNLDIHCFFDIKSTSNTFLVLNFSLCILEMKEFMIIQNIHIIKVRVKEKQMLPLKGHSNKICNIKRQNEANTKRSS